MDYDRSDFGYSGGQTFSPLPPHSNKMVWAILSTIFCCLIGGIVAIVYSAESNSLYNAAMFSSDSQKREYLYYESEKKNKTARTWIIISAVFLIVNALVSVVLWSMGLLAGVVTSFV